MKKQVFYAIMIGTWIWLKWCFITIWARLRGKNNYFIVQGWSDEGINRVYQRLDINIELDDQIDEIPKDKPIVVVGNHPSTFAFFATGFGVRTCLPGRYPKVVGAMKHWFTPLGWAIAAMDGIAVNRNNPTQALKAIQRGIEKTGPNTMFMIYPEGHRAFDSRIAQNRLRLMNRGKVKQAERYKHTLSGRPTGALAVRQGLPDATWIRMYVSFDRPEVTRVKETHKLIGSALHIHMSRINTPPKNREGVKKWLDEELLGQCNDWIEDIIKHRIRTDITEPRLRAIK